MGRRGRQKQKQKQKQSVTVNVNVGRRSAARPKSSASTRAPANNPVATVTRHIVQNIMPVPGAMPINHTNDINNQAQRAHFNHHIQNERDHLLSVHADNPLMKQSISKLASHLSKSDSIYSLNPSDWDGVSDSGREASPSRKSSMAGVKQEAEAEVPMEVEVPLPQPVPPEPMLLGDDPPVAERREDVPNYNDFQLPPQEVIPHIPVAPRVNRNPHVEEPPEEIRNHEPFQRRLEPPRVINLRDAMARDAVQGIPFFGLPDNLAINIPDGRVARRARSERDNDVNERPRQIKAIESAPPLLRLPPPPSDHGTLDSVRDSEHINETMKYIAEEKERLMKKAQKYAQRLNDIKAGQGNSAGNEYAALKSKIKNLAKNTLAVVASDSLHNFVNRRRPDYEKMLLKTINKLK